MVTEPRLLLIRGCIDLLREFRVMPRSVVFYGFIPASSLSSLLLWLTVKEEFMPPGPHPAYFGIIFYLSLLPLEFLDKLLFLDLILSTVYILLSAFFVLLACWEIYLCVCLLSEGARGLGFCCRERTFEMLGASDGIDESDIVLVWLFYLFLKGMLGDFFCFLRCWLLEVFSSKSYLFWNWNFIFNLGLFEFPRFPNVSIDSWFN